MGVIQDLMDAQGWIAGPRSNRCAVIITEYTEITPKDDLQFCRNTPEIPMCLPSGRVVAYVCKDHEKVASA